MTIYHSSKYKLRNIQRTIDSLLDGDFPLSAGRSALTKLRDVLSTFDGKLDLAQKQNDQDNLDLVAHNLSVKIYQVLPILGFVLRSTNVRNAFEMVEPLHRIAKAALQGNPQLILSSEWDYVPFAYPQSLDNLKSFIFIGLPASEAASALLMPIAGHELGHAVWRNRGIGAGLQGSLQMKCEEHYSKNMHDFQLHFTDYDPKDLVRRFKLDEAISESSKYASFQAEELFSDLFAYACFGASYLRAFSYVLAPGEGVIANPKYPLNSTRVNVIRKVAAEEHVLLPDSRALGFKPDGRRGDGRDQFVVRMAEAAVADTTDELWKTVLKISERAPLVRPKPEEAVLHLKNLNVGIPSARAVCVGDIIIAGWQRYDEITESGPTAKEVSEKLSQLNEVLLKTIEVFEYRRRTS